MWTLELNELVLWLILAFCGGMAGAAMGGLCSFVLCGFGALISSIFLMAGNPEVANFTDAWITWGPFVGPQVAFVGGGWAAVYAKHHAGFHNGRDICKPLAGLNRPDVLMVGGLGGVCGAVTTWLFWLLPDYNVDGQTIASANDVACGVAVAAMIGRCILGKTGLFGKVAPGVSRWVGNEKACWLPWQHDKLQIMVLAVAIGFPTAYLTHLNANTHLLVFGVMCVLFLFMILGQAMIAGHHFAICAYFATAATGNVFWGLAMAILVGYLCEISAFLFTSHGDSHIDPPTCGIMCVGLLQPLLIWTGIMKLNTSGAPLNDPFFNDINAILGLAVIAISAPLLLHILRKIPPVAAEKKEVNNICDKIEINNEQDIEESKELVLE